MLGTLKIKRQEDAGTYQIVFLSYSNDFQNGAQPTETICDEKSMREYLIKLQPASVSLETQQARAKQWLLELQSKGRIEFENTEKP